MKKRTVKKHLYPIQMKAFSAKIGAYLMLLALLFCSINVSAQTKKITGTVFDEMDLPLIGVSVVIAGTTNGTLTDIDGAYSLNVKTGDVIQFSFVGMVSQEVTIKEQTLINIVLNDATHLLDETVVIGYGSAKAKDLTSPIATIKGDDINKHISASPMAGLQGKIPGMQIINSGEPGSSPKVRIRGVGNMDAGRGGPLYVVDGMFFDNIDFLNNSEIENISVLKDASASAIYGVRAANGVVLVTTKKGVTNKKPQITYDGYVGVQRAQNLQKMANSKEYTTMLREVASRYDPMINSGNLEDRENAIKAKEAILAPIENSISRYGGANGIPSTNTDWYKELTKLSPMHNHSLSIAGGGEKSTYSVGASYLNQEGIMRNAETGFERLNLRARVDLNVNNWLKVGGNMVVINSTNNKGTMKAYEHAYTTPSIVPVYDADNYNADLNPGGYSSVHQLGYGQYFWNPMGVADYYKLRNKQTATLPSFYAELSFLDSRLTIRSSYNQELRFDRYRTYTPKYAISSYQQATDSELYKGTEFNNRWLIDNVATFRDTFGKHTITAMVGNSIRRDMMELMNMTANGVPAGKEEYWYIYQGKFKAYNLGAENNTWPDDGSEIRGASYFGRLMYDYAGRYLLSATFRADGSNKYQEKWGYFPSVGLGWVVSEENFMQSQNFIDFLKVRGSWGKLGNDDIEPNRDFRSISHNSGAFNDMLLPGVNNVAFFSRLKWEMVKEWNIGLDFAILNNRLSGELDYYNRKTTNAVFKRPLPLTYETLLMNNGEIENSGFEISLNWTDKVSKDFSYNIGVNASTLKNKVTYLDGVSQLITSGDYSTIRRVGETVDSFYGYKVEGIYQTQAEIDNDLTIAHLSEGKPTVGSFKYRDLDGDGKLTDADRDIIGSALPKFFMGGNIGLNFKDWDFGIAFQGQFGHKIINLKRFNRQKQFEINFDQDLVKNRWTGEGSTNKYPSAIAWTEPWNYKFNNFFTESGNTFTIQNIQLGYTFKGVLPNADKSSSLRIGFTAERPFSFFSYNGFTTDISNGIDLDPYPMASTYTLGVKIIY